MFSWRKPIVGLPPTVWLGRSLDPTENDASLSMWNFTILAQRAIEVLSPRSIYVHLNPGSAGWCRQQVSLDAFALMVKELV